jgi:RNA polymerase sigma-70 factor (ECF subfamily)
MPPQDFVGHPQPSIETHERSSNNLVALIKRVAEQDQLAMTRFYDVTNRLVFGLISRIVGDAAAAEEVLLDVYMQAWRQASRYSEERGSPIAWLTTIARSRALDRLRADAQTQRRSQPLDLATQHAATGWADDVALASEVRTVVQHALNSLSPEQKEVIELAYYGGLSHSEIALRLGQPLGTVKTRTRLGMTKLRTELKPLIAEGKL